MFLNEMSLIEYNNYIMNNLVEIITYIFTLNVSKLNGNHIHSFGVFLIMISIILNIFL